MYGGELNSSAKPSVESHISSSPQSTEIGERSKVDSRGSQENRLSVLGTMRNTYEVRTMARSPVSLV